MPAALYRLAMDKSRTNPHPVMITDSGARTTSFQVRQPLLCDECEQRFHAKGEDWVMANCYRGSSEFSLREKLKTTSRVGVCDDLAAFSAASVSGLDIAPLSYFAASVFWRAAAATWRCLDHDSKLELGPYEGQLSEFLLGQEEFPSCAVLIVTISSAPGPLNLNSFPVSGPRILDSRQYWFTIPGIAFQLVVGKKIHPTLKLMCVLRSPQKLVFYSTLAEKRMIEAMTEAAARHPFDR